MGQLVNYKKRSFTLPPGCKDLIDVLVPSVPPPRSQLVSSNFQRPQVIKDHVPTAGLAQIGHYVSMLLQSRGALFVWSVMASDFDCPVRLYRRWTEQIGEIVLVTPTRHREQAIRAFFEQRSIEAIRDYALSDLGATYAPRILAYALPSEAARATVLVTELLRSVYGVSGAARLDFRYYEIKAVP